MNVCACACLCKCVMHLWYDWVSECVCKCERVNLCAFRDA